MRSTVFGAVALTISLFAANGAAEPPSVVLVQEEAATPPMVQPVRPVRPTAARLIKSAETLVLQTVQMTVWEGQEGQCAVLNFDPLGFAGGKFRITYEF